MGRDAIVTELASAMNELGAKHGLAFCLAVKLPDGTRTAFNNFPSDADGKSDLRDLLFTVLEALDGPPAWVIRSAPDA